MSVCSGESKHHWIVWICPWYTGERCVKNRGRGRRQKKVFWRTEVYDAYQWQAHNTSRCHRNDFSLRARSTKRERERKRNIRQERKMKKKISEEKREQVPRGYNRCDYFIVTHCTIVYDTIWWLFTLKNDHLRRSKVTWDRPMDLRTDGRTRPLMAMRSRI